MFSFKQMWKNFLNKKEKPETPQKEKKSSNLKELSSSIFYSCIEGIRMIMASLLSVFVPQYCPETGTTCTLSDNFTNLSEYNVFVLAINFITLASYVKLLFIQNSREAYLISHLDESKDYPINSLEENIKSYPNIAHRIRSHNKRLYIYTKVVLGMMMFNILFSSILIFYYFYDGFRSVTTMLSNILLISSKLYSLYTISVECTGVKLYAYSTIHQSNISYNIPDEQYDKYGLFHVSTAVHHKAKRDLNRYKLKVKNKN